MFATIVCVIVAVMCIGDPFSGPTSPTEELHVTTTTDERDKMPVDRYGRNLTKIDNEWLDRMEQMRRRAFPREHAEQMKPKKKRAYRKRKKQTKIKGYLHKTK